MDGYLAVVAKREVRRYLDRPIPDEILTKILQAGRASGSAKNSQPWRFIALRDGAKRAALAEMIMAPRNLEGCAAAIAVVLTNERLRFDAGRVAQNMMVAAWALGIGSCVNSVRPDSQDRMREALGYPADAVVATIVTLGYPANGEPHPNPKAKAEKVLKRVDRRPLEEIVSYERYDR
jgi:nitroreductase